jgi:hypothetical protein
VESKEHIYEFGIYVDDYKPNGSHSIEPCAPPCAARQALMIEENSG